MELTQIKGSMFGYKKADVVQYISELNELHTAEIQNREADLDELKKSSEAEITALKEENIQLSSKVEKLSEQLNSVVAELNSTLSALDNLKTEHNTLLDETSELRERSEFISTAIIKAEKCAGILINEARSNAQEMVDNAQKKVELEKERLTKARDYVSDIRKQFNELALQINSVLGTTETDIEVKINKIEKAGK
jgi:uncharacterized coiled-coil DUF342 family protein